MQALLTEGPSRPVVATTMSWIRPPLIVPAPWSPKSGRGSPPSTVNAKGPRDSGGLSSVVAQPSESEDGMKPPGTWSGA